MAAGGQNGEVKAEEVPPHVVLEAVSDALLLLTLIEEQQPLKVGWQRVLGFLDWQAPLGTGEERK